MIIFDKEEKKMDRYEYISHEFLIYLLKYVRTHPDKKMTEEELFSIAKKEYKREKMWQWYVNLCK